MFDAHHEKRVSPLSSDDKVWFRRQFHCVWVRFPAGILSLWFLGKKRVLDLQGQRGFPRQVVYWISPEPVLLNCPMPMSEPSITHDAEAACFLSSMGFGGSQTCTHFLCFRLVLSRKTYIWFRVGICLSYLLLFKWGHSILEWDMVCWTVFLLVRITMLSAILFSVTVKQFTFLFQVVPCRLSLAYTCTQLGSAGKLGQPLVCSRYLIFSLCVCLLYHTLSAYT